MLVTEDRDQQFRDWAEPITLRTLAQTYNPETLQVANTPTDIPLEAIIGVLPTTPTPGAAGHHASQHLTLTLKREDLPALAPHPLTRVLWNNAEYEVLDATENPTAHLIALHCRRIS